MQTFYLDHAMFIHSNARFEICKSNDYIVACHALDEIANKMFPVLLGFYENRKENGMIICVDIL